MSKNVLTQVIISNFGNAVVNKIKTCKIQRKVFVRENYKRYFKVEHYFQSAEILVQTFFPNTN